MGCRNAVRTALLLGGVLGACGSPYGGGIAPWREQIPVQPRTACERAVIADAPALGARISALASEIETAPLDSARSTALAARLRELVIDDLASLKDNRRDRSQVLTSVRDGATRLERGERLAPSALAALRRLAREAPEEIPRDATYVETRCWAMPAKSSDISTDELSRSATAASSIAPAFARADVCRALASQQPTWPWRPPPQEVRASLEACRDEMHSAYRRCQAEVAPFVDQHDIAVLARASDLAKTLHALTEGTLARAEAILIAERLRAKIDSIEPPLSALPAFASVLAELEALAHPGTDADAAGSRALYRVRGQLELLTFPCELLGSVENQLVCVLQPCVPPHPT